jgi:hypothetical protein
LTVLRSHTSKNVDSRPGGDHLGHAVASSSTPSCSWRAGDEPQPVDVAVVGEL